MAAVETEDDVLALIVEPGVALRSEIVLEATGTGERSVLLKLDSVPVLDDEAGR